MHKSEVRIAWYRQTTTNVINFIVYIKLETA